MCLIENYGARCFLSELVNSCLQTNTEFMIAPYAATHQLVYLFKEQLVHCVCGSVLTLLNENLPNLNQVIVDFEFESGIFQFVEREDLLTVFSPKKDISTILDLFLSFGALYGLQATDDCSPTGFAKSAMELS